MSELIQFEGRTVAVIAPEDLEELEIKVATLQREVERLMDVNNRHEQRRVELAKEIGTLKSWERSVLAEVGDALHHSTPWKQMVDHYKHRAEHLAAKLLEAQSCQVSTTRALQAAERIAITAHECWDKDQDYKVGKLLLAMIRNDLKYSDDCTIFRMGIQAIDGQPAPNPIEISRELFDAATGALAPKSGGTV